MSRAAIRLTVAGSAATGALVIALDLGPHERALALAAYLSFICALALVGLAGAIGSGLPPAGRLLGTVRRRRPGAEPLPGQLAWIERQLAVARASELDLHTRFRPLITQIASATLARRHGIDLEGEGRRVQALVGEQLWELIRADRPKPEAPFARGLAADDVRRVIDELEAI